MGRAEYLEKKYGITAVEYAQMAIVQGGACKCCGNIPKGDYPLHVDHSHRVAATKIRVERAGNSFVAIAVTDKFLSPTFVYVFREAAIKAAKRWLLRKSVRGLVCWKCNTVLRWARDSAEILRAAAKYLDEYITTL